MLINKRYCDKKDCNREAVGERIIAYHSRERDASGNGYVRLYAVFDLCQEHLGRFLNALLDTFDPQSRIIKRDPLKILKDFDIDFGTR